MLNRTHNKENYVNNFVEYNIICRVGTIILTYSMEKRVPSVK